MTPTHKDQPHLKEIFYRVLKSGVRIASNSLEWLESLDSFLCLNREDPFSAREVELTVLLTPAAGINEVVTLPDRIFMKNEVPSFLGPESSYRLFALENVSWSDWGGYGRIRTEREAGKALAVINSESRWDPFFSVLLFGYNALMGLLYRGGLFSVHASCASVGGKGVLFAGQSGSGKSTAACAMLRRGHALVSDDRALLSQQGSYRALNISDVFKIREEALLKFFPALRSIVPFHHVLDEYYYKIKKLPDLSYVPDTSVSALMVLDKTGTAGSSIERVHPAKVVKDLFPVTMNPYDPEQTEGKFRFLMDMLKKVPCFSVSFGTDMDLFAERVEQIAQGI